MKSINLATTFVIASAALACGERGQPAIGRATSIIVAVPDSLWAEIQDSLLTALEPRIFTVRDERAFEVTQVSPLVEDWRQLRRLRQVLAIGTPEDGWMAPVLNGDVPATLPAILEKQHVWARNQLVTAIVLPPGGGAEDVRLVLDSVSNLMDSRFREYARSRMFVSGVDSALQDTLIGTSGFALLLPQVYTYERGDSSWAFRNHSEMSGTLLRTILVTWRSGVAEQLGVEPLIAWRDSAGDVAYDPPQDVQPEHFETRALEPPIGPGLEVQGVWRSEDTSWPAAGPFISRAIPCPDQNRTYLLDAWLFAPGPTRSKYEYLIQLNTILDSFRCGRAAQEAARAATR